MNRFNTLHILTLQAKSHAILTCTILFTLLLVGSCCTSCNRYSRLTNELRNIHGTKLNINHDKMFHYTSEFSQCHVPHQGNVKILVYLDSTVCSTCELNSLDTWKNEIFGSDTIDRSIRVCFILQSPQSKFSELYEKLKTYDTGYDIYIDSTDVFRIENPNLPTSKMLHTFLLDENNVVLLCGNPQRSMKINNLFKNEIHKRLQTKQGFRKLRVEKNFE